MGAETSLKGHSPSPDSSVQQFTARAVDAVAQIARVVQQQARSPQEANNFFQQLINQGVAHANSTNVQHQQQQHQQQEQSQPPMSPAEEAMGRRMEPVIIEANADEVPASSSAVDEAANTETTETLPTKTYDIGPGEWLAIRLNSQQELELSVPNADDGTLRYMPGMMASIGAVVPLTVPTEFSMDADVITRDTSGQVALFNPEAMRSYEAKKAFDEAMTALQSKAEREADQRGLAEGPSRQHFITQTVQNWSTILTQADSHLLIANPETIGQETVSPLGFLLSHHGQASTSEIFLETLRDEENGTTEIVLTHSSSSEKAKPVGKVALLNDICIISVNPNAEGYLGAVNFEWPRLKINTNIPPIDISLLETEAFGSDVIDFAARLVSKNDPVTPTRIQTPPQRRVDQVSSRPPKTKETKAPAAPPVNEQLDAGGQAGDRTNEGQFDDARNPFASLAGSFVDPLGEAVAPTETGASRFRRAIDQHRINQAARHHNGQGRHRNGR